MEGTESGDKPMTTNDQEKDSQVTELENKPLPTGDQKDYVQKELDQIQGIISRMASNSFQCKGWAIGIVTIVLALSKDTLLLPGWQSSILFLPILVFWYLDGFFLYTEQCYRDLFNDVVKRRFKQDDWEDLFDYKYTRVEHEKVQNGSFWLRHMPIFIKNRATRLFYKVTFRPAKAPKKISTIPSVMFSKTLLPFYLLPMLFVGFAVYKGDEAEKQPEKTKEPLVIKIDSSTLNPLLRALEKPVDKATKDNSQKK